MSQITQPQKSIILQFQNM